MNLLTFSKGSKGVLFILWVLIFALDHPAAAQDAPTIITRAIAAHGGVALGLINNSVTTGQLTDPRVNGGQPVSATIKTYGKLNRLEYTVGSSSVAHIRNGTMAWESTGTQVKEVVMRGPAFRELFYNPSLGIVSTLASAGFSYRSTTTLRGRSVYVLRKAYTIYTPQESFWPGPTEFIDLYIDTATYLIAQVDYTYGSEYNRLSFRYDAYQTISNVAVPMTVSFWINSQNIWQFQVQSVLFNQTLDPRQFMRP